MAVTAVVLGRQCFPAATIDAAIAVAQRLDNPLLAGELGGHMPYGFDLDNSPADLTDRDDTARPIVLVSTTGTQLISEAAEASAPPYIACLRNFAAQAEHLVVRHPRVALVGAGSRGEFREEDQLCCAWIGKRLIEAGYTPEGNAGSLIERWQSASVEDMLISNSVRFLRSTDRERDLDFILTHVEDVNAVMRVINGEVVRCS
jgi:2-phosphosulfolactate phosphatase